VYANGAIVTNSVHSGSVTARYYQTGSVDGNLLFAGIKLSQPGASGNVDWAVVDMMSQAVVSAVDSNGSVYFTLGDAAYKAYWEGGNVKLDYLTITSYVDQLQAAMGKVLR